MFKVSVDRIMPLSEARARLSEIIEQTAGEDMWVVTKNGKPRVAVVDVQYLDELLRRSWFDALAVRTQDTFRRHLAAQGIDADALSEEEAEKLLAT